VSTEHVSGGIVLVPKGRIGSVTAGTFASALKAARAIAPRVIVDLAAIDYISGEGIRALQAGSETGSQTIICGLQDAVRITLDLAGTLDGIAVMTSRREAVESLITDH
jgi:anti-anti-sigma factor